VRQIQSAVLVVWCSSLFLISPIPARSQDHSRGSAVARTPELKIPPEVADCAFLATEKPNETTSKNWSFYETGLDIFRNYLSTLKIDYSNTSLSIHDSGLNAKGNPHAGPQLEALSTEEVRDENGHGTHVAGIVGAEAYGVNPALPLKMRKIAVDGGIDEFAASLINTLEEAANDPTTKVVSVSMISYEQPGVKEAVQKLMDKGVWIVYASGNDGQVNHWSNGLLRELSLKKELFPVGAISSLGLPTYFSNFGPNVDIYAPGQGITSLNYQYDPLSPKSKRDLQLSGTSMAAPYAAAVLTTLRAIYPELTPDEARELFKETSIVRGIFPHEVLEMNPLLMANYLGSYANAKKNKSCDTLKECFPRIQMVHKKWVQEQLDKLKAPTTADCSEWSLYYNRLRKLYRYTKGNHPTLNARLVALGSLRGDVKAKAVYYSSKQDVAKALAKFSDQHENFTNRDAIAGAKEFLKSGIPREVLKHEIPSVEASLANFEEVWRKCQATFFVKFDTDGACYDALRTAPASLRTAIAQRLIQADRPLTSIWLVNLLKMYEDKEAHGLNDRLISLAQRGVESRLAKSIDDQWMYWIPRMPLVDRQKFADFANSKFSLLAKVLVNPNLTEAELQRIAPRVYLSSFPALARLKLELDRHTAGLADPSALKGILDAIVNGAPSILAHCKVAPGDTSSRPPSCSEVEDALTDTLRTLALLMQDPKSAAVLTDYFSQPKRMKGMAYLFADRQAIEFSDPSLLPLLMPLVSKAPPPLRGRILTLIAAHWCAPNAERRGQVLSDVLRLNKELPEVALVIDDMFQREPRTDIWKGARLNYLTDLFLDSNVGIEERVKFYKKATLDEKMHLRNPVEALGTDPELQAMVKQNVKEWRTFTWPQFSKVILEWMDKPEGADVIMPDLLPHLANVFKYNGGGVTNGGSLIYQAEDAAKLATQVADWVHRHPENAESAMAHAVSLLTDTKFFNGDDIIEDVPDPASGYEPIPLRPERKSHTMEFILSIASTPGGAAYLDKHPEVSRKIASTIVNEDLAGAVSWNYGAKYNGDSLPKGIVDELRSRLPSVQEVKKLRKLPEWVASFALHDNESFHRMIEYGEAIHGGVDGPRTASKDAIRQVNFLTVYLGRLIEANLDSYNQSDLQALTRLIDRNAAEEKRRMELPR